MSWRSVVIAHPASLSLWQQALLIRQAAGQAHVPLEDIAALVIDHPQVSLTAQLLSACAEAGIALLTVGRTHHPNGVLLPFLPHGRTVRIMQAQLALGVPRGKQLWQQIIRRKIANQAHLLAQTGAAAAARQLQGLAGQVRSGDPDNVEGQAAQVYFRALFNPHFGRKQSRFHNAALNYAYAVIRAAIARSLVLHGFLPAFGLHHHNEQNAFNLADDLIEPCRPCADSLVTRHYPTEPDRDLVPEDKGRLVSVLHQQVAMSKGETKAQDYCTLLAAIEAMVISLQQIVMQGLPAGHLCLPVLAEPVQDDME